MSRLRSAMRTVLGTQGHGFIVPCGTVFRHNLGGAERFVKHQTAFQHKCAGPENCEICKREQLLLRYTHQLDYINYLHENNKPTDDFSVSLCYPDNVILKIVEVKIGESNKSACEDKDSNEIFIEDIGKLINLSWEFTRGHPMLPLEYPYWQAKCAVARQNIHVSLEKHPNAMPQVCVQYNEDEVRYFASMKDAADYLKKRLTDTITLIENAIK